MKGRVELYSQPQLENPSLIVGWQEDAGRLGWLVLDYLLAHIQGRSFGEIGPEGFFPLNGISIEDDVARFPESQFYAGTRKDLIIFRSNQPPAEHYSFLNSLLDMAQHYCRVTELYTVSGTITPVAHSGARRLLAVFNQPAQQRRLRGLGLEDMTWEGPPAINSYLLWLARKREIPGVSLWPEVSFYLAAAEDFKAARAVLTFFDRRFQLGLPLAVLDEKIRQQDERLALLRKQDAEIDKLIRILEMGLSLSEEEQLRLARGVTDFLGKKSG